LHPIVFTCKLWTWAKIWRLWQTMRPVTHLPLEDGSDVVAHASELPGGCARPTRMALGEGVTAPAPPARDVLQALFCEPSRSSRDAAPLLRTPGDRMQGGEQEDDCECQHAVALKPERRCLVVAALMSAALVRGAGHGQCSQPQALLSVTASPLPRAGWRDGADVGRAQAIARNATKHIWARGMASEPVCFHSSRRSRRAWGGCACWLMTLHTVCERSARPCGVLAAGSRRPCSVVVMQHGGIGFCARTCASVRV
jgi:hypothetical protein